MEIASLILGIISIVISLIPFIGILAYLPAIIALILGIVSLATMKSRGKNNKAMPLVGIVTSSISMVLAIVMILVWGFISAGIYSNKSIKNNEYNGIENRNHNYSSNYNYENNTHLSRIREYEIGDKIRLKDCTLVINSIEDFDGNSNLKATSGNELILVDVTITNTGNSQTYVSKYDFEINDGDDYSYPEYDSTHKVATFESQSISSGESYRGTLCFQKEKYNNNYYLVYDNNVKIKVK